MARPLLDHDLVHRPLRGERGPVLRLGHHRESLLDAGPDPRARPAPARSRRVPARSPSGTRAVPPSRRAPDSPPRPRRAPLAGTCRRHRPRPPGRAILPHVVGAPSDPCPHRLRLQVAAERLRRVDGGRTTLVHDEGDEAHESTSPRAAAIAPSTSSVAGPPPTRACSRNSAFPAGPVIGETDHSGGRGASRVSGRGDVLDRATPDRRIGDHAARPDLVATGLELGLDEEHEVGVRLRRRDQRTEHRAQRDERQVGRDERRAEREGGRGPAPGRSSGRGPSRAGPCAAPRRAARSRRRARGRVGRRAGAGNR